MPRSRCGGRRRGETWHDHATALRRTDGSVRRVRITAKPIDPDGLEGLLQSVAARPPEGD